MASKRQRDVRRVPIEFGRTHCSDPALVDASGRLAREGLARVIGSVVLALEVGQWYWRGDAYGCGRVGSSVHMPG